MLILNIRSDAERIARQFGSIGMRQLPFALARGLTWLAQDAQKEVRRELPHRFIIRNHWTEKGIRIDMSRKNDYRVTVYTKDPYMDRHEEGAIKRPKRDSHLAIPDKIVRTKRGIIRKRDLPDQLRSRNIFIINHRTKREKLNLPFGIYRRQGRKKPIRLYYLKPSVWVEPRWEFGRTVEKVVKARFHRVFSLSLDDAIRTAR